jgi:hypothetical protein
VPTVPGRAAGRDSLSARKPGRYRQSARDSGTGTEGVVFERRPVTTGTLPFDEFNASGPRQPATAKTAAEVRRIHLGYVPIAGKYVGRRSPRAGEMIRFLGRRPDFDDRDPAAQIRALRGIAKDLSSRSWGQLGDAVACYLDLVEATVRPGAERSA